MDPRIRMLLRIIGEKNGDMQLGSSEAAGLLGLGEAHMLRLFNRNVGSTFRGYLRDIRMTRAAQSVKDSVKPLKCIASTYGYSDLSNFYRDFKRVHGITPMRMRLDQVEAKGLDGLSQHCRKSIE